MIRVVTPPAAYPCTLTEAKAWCRVRASNATQDGVLNMLIAAATAHAEHLTGRAFVERTLELNLDRWPACIELPQPPLLGVTAIGYTDSNNAAAAVSSGQYETDTVREPGRLRPVYSAYWPALGRGFNPVRITYQAGYRPAGSPIDLTDNSYLPPALRAWLEARICTLFDNRDHLVAGVSAAAVQIPRDFVDALLDPLIVGTRLFGEGA